MFRMDARKLLPLSLIAVLPMYVAAVNMVPAEISYGGCGNSVEKGTTEDVGFCTRVSATVQRDYYLGLAEMKTRALGANIDPLSELMPAAVFFLMAGSYRLLNQSKH